ncbi:hypothetical protein JHK86_025091 [Glycine max]|nr:hypothetical protein JHK86_025091 [Glycine max]
MSTWKDLDLSNKDKEKEAKICLMVGTTSEESELEQKDEVDLDDPDGVETYEAGLVTKLLQEIKEWQRAD